MKNSYFQTLILLATLVLAACGTTPPTTDISPDRSHTRSPTGEKITPTHTLLVPNEPSPSATQESLPVLNTEGGADADVVFVRAVLEADNTWTFHVTVLHPDTGWDDYTDGWDVVTPDGIVLTVDPDDTFTRLLLHPHVGEQPFTRSQGGIQIPDGVIQVRVRAHDILDGFGGREVMVDLTEKTGPDFKVER